MRAILELDEYLASPGPAVFVGKRCAAFRAPGVFGAMAWGAPDVRDAELFVRARAGELVSSEPHVLLIDYRLLESVDPDVFRCLATWVGANADALRERTTRSALVPPQEAFAGATVSGFYSVFQSPYPSKVCATLAAADEWLGLDVTSLVAQAEALAVRGALTTELGHLLEKSPRLSIDEAAAALGLSARTLQRRLSDEQTSYRAEVRQATMRVAKRLLATTDMKVGEIATAAGCASAQHFTDLFREETGTTPAAWRAKTRSPET